VALVLAIFAAVALATISTGCKSPEQTAYAITASTAVTVDGAMNGWGDFVRAGMASKGDEDVVRKAYEKYQRASSLAKIAVVTAKTSPEGEKEFETALRALDLAKGELIAIIRTFISKQ
jgi:hypothetical protein